jgi:hypothetical protein
MNDWTTEIAKACQILSYREAQKQHGVSYRSWKKARDQGTFIPQRTSGGETAEFIAKIRKDIQESPQLNTAVRGRNLHISTARLQKTLKSLRLTKLNQRL